jgi:phosphatidylinositol kinase/protein kinase (PI-3  family)
MTVRENNDEIIKNLLNRFKLDLNEMDYFNFINSLIDDSMDNFYTKGYDKFQFFQNGIL